MGPSEAVTSSTRPPHRPVAGAALAFATLFSLGAAPVLAAEPSAPGADAASASILIVTLDTHGTLATDDDTLLDGVLVAVHADDGDGAFDPGLDAVVAGPMPAVGGLLDTQKLGSGRYWVDADPLTGHEAPPPILVELNTDGSRTCVWDAAGLIECQANDAGAEGLSWTMVLVRNAPAATPSPTASPPPAPTAVPTDPAPAPTGEVHEATGRPAVTLPPTDRAATSGERPDPAPATWVLLFLASLIVVMTRAARRSRAATGPVSRI